MEAGTSVSNLAQSLSGTASFFGTNYSSSLGSSEFADAFITDLVGNNASTADLVWVKSYVVDRMANGDTQADIINFLTRALASVSTADASWGAAATNYHTDVATKIIDNLVGSSATDAAKTVAVNFIVNQMAAGQSVGAMVDWAITALDNADYADGTWGSAAALFDNRIEVSRYYSVDKAGAATDLGTLQQALAAVTTSAESITTAKALFDTAQSGIAQDGYLSGATVFVDMNGDGILNTGETSVTTDAYGNFTLPAGAFGKIVATGGTDISTNLAFSGAINAPAGSSMVTPLTTVMQAMVDSGSTVAQAQTNALTALGLPLTTNLQTLDAIATALGSNTTAEQAAAAQVHAVMAKVAIVLTQGVAVLQGADSTTSATAAMTAMVTALATNFSAASTTVDLTDTSVIESVIISAATVTSTVATTAVTASLDDIASVLTSSVSMIDTAMTDNPTDLTAALSQIAKVQVVVEDVATSLLTEMDGGSIATTVSSFTGTALDTAVTAAEAGDLTEDVTATSGTSTTTTGGGSTPAATFTVINTGGALTFGGTATGNITVSWAGTVNDSEATFTRATLTGTADFTSTATGKATSIALVAGNILSSTAANVAGVTISGADGAVTLTDTTLAVTALNTLDGTIAGTITATVATGTAADLANLTGTGNAYTTTLSAGTATAAHLNTIDATTTVAVGAAAVSIITGTVADVKTAGASAGITTATDYAATLSDGNTTNILATDLSTIGGDTTGIVTATNAINITGTTTEATAALVTAGTLVVAASATVAVSDATIAAADLAAIDGKTSGLVTAASLTKVTGTATEVDTFANAETAGTAIAATTNYAAEVSGTDMTVTQANNIDGKNGTGVITGAVDVTTAVAALKTLTSAGAANAYTIVIAGGDATSAAADLTLINAATTVAVGAANVTTITGTDAEVGTVYTAAGSSEFSGLGDEAVTLSGTSTTTNLAAINGATTGNVDATALTAISGTATALQALVANDGNGDTVNVDADAAGQDATVTDVLGTDITAAALTTLDANYGTVTVTNAIDITGAHGDVTTIMGAITAAAANALISDATITAANLGTLDAAIGGTITTSAGGGAGAISITALTGATVAATASVDTFTFAGGDTGVTITGFTANTDIIDLDGLASSANIGPTNLAGGNEELIINEVFYLLNQATGSADAAPAAITALNSAANLTDTANTSFVVISDDNSTGIFSWLGGGTGNEATGDTLTLLGTIDGVITDATTILI